MTLAPDDAANVEALERLDARRFPRPGLSALRSLPSTHSQFAQHLIPLAESGIVFEPDIQKSEDQSFKSQLLEDIDELYKPTA